MSEEENKYSVDLNKVKNSKLYQKFVKNMDNQKAKEQKNLPKPIDYQINYQNQYKSPSIQKQARETTIKNPQYVDQPQKVLKKEKRNNILENSQVHINQIQKQKDIRQKIPEAQTNYEEKVVHQQNFEQVRKPERNLNNDNKNQNYPTRNQGRRARNFAPPATSNNSRQRKIEPTYLIKEDIKQNESQAEFQRKKSIEQISFIQEKKNEQTNFNNQNDPNNVLKQLQEYKTKLEKITQAYEQFKNTSIIQNRQKKSQLLGYQQTIEIFKQKLYQIQTKQDQLTLQNQKLKQKLSTQTIFKTRLQQENKELNYRIQEMTDMLDSRQSSLKKKTDEAVYWKNQTDTTKTQFHNLKLANQRLSQSLREYEEQFQFLKRQKQNQEALQNDLKDKVTFLIRQNAKLKDQLYYKSSKLTELQHENYSLKTDLKRQNQTGQHYQPSHIPFRQQQRVEQRIEQRIEQNPIQRQNNPRQQRRRGQFNKQRQRMNENRADNSKIMNNNQVQIKKINVIKQVDELLNKKRQIEQQVQKLRDLKAMNGAIRKKKIQMQRELQSINIKITELRGEGKNN